MASDYIPNMLPFGEGYDDIVGSDGQPDLRWWFIDDEGIKRWSDDGQPHEEQPPGNPKPMCAVNGVIYGQQEPCCMATGFSNPKRCKLVLPCKHKMAGK